MRIPDQSLDRLNLLKAIRRWGPVSRTELFTHLDLSSGWIALLTAELLDRGLICECRKSNGKPGRPRKNLEIDPGGDVVIGATLTAAGVLDVSFVDLLGQRLHSEPIRLGPQPALDTMPLAIADALAKAIANSPFRPDQISRVGLAIAATVNGDRGDVHFMATFPVAGPVPFAAPIAKRLGLPVTIENDLTCMARAEHWFGRARDLDSFTLVHVGWSIGSAEYADGLPKSGAKGLNSELGHIKSVYGEDARTCFCGRHGCLTTYASMFGILDAAGELSDLPFPPTAGLDERFERFLDQAESGDPVSRDALEEAGTRLGRALANFINVSDPGNVLVAIASPRFLSFLAPSLHRALQDNVMECLMLDTKVELLVTQEDWRWKGAAALAIEQAYLGNDADSARQDTRRFAKVWASESWAK